MKKRTIIFIIILLLTSLAVAALGYGIQNYLLLPLGIQREEHLIALPFVLLKDEMLQAQVENALEDLNTPPTEPPEATIPTVPETTVPETTVPEPTIPETTVPVLDESWFDDALFIGESRIQGLQHFGRLGKADYFCAASMTVLGVLDAKLSDDAFTDTTLDTLLKSRDYGKVYIHLGINETPLGPDGIMRSYQKIIDRVRQLEPEAIIVLMGCMAVTEKYESNSRVDMNVIHQLNEKLKNLADSDPEVYRYCDTSAWSSGDNGYLIPEISHDGCHLYAERYADWCAFLMEEAEGYGIP